MILFATYEGVRKRGKADRGNLMPSSKSDDSYAEKGLELEELHQQNLSLRYNAVLTQQKIAKGNEYPGALDKVSGSERLILKEPREVIAIPKWG